VIKKQYSTLKELLDKELETNEEPQILALMKKFRPIMTRGYFTKEEFLEMARWKSPRPNRNYQNNSKENIKRVSKAVFSTRYEERKMELLTSLDGVSIPVASTILTLTDPKNYGIMDIRVWQLLYRYDLVKVNPRGTNFNFKNWDYYLTNLRYYAKEFNVKTRDVERSLFYHHRKMHKGNLYNSKFLTRFTKVVK